MAPRRVVKDCPAKLNLFLEILGRRPDGYHELSTVMAPVGVYDTLELRPARGFRLELEGASLPGMNLVEKAYRAVAKRAKIPGARARLVKRIPAGSGLGGGSSDAAATIEALDELYGLGLDRHAVAAEIGSDLNLFLEERPALCTGRGERVAPLAFPLPLHAVIVWPGFALSTAEVFRGAREFLTPRPRSVMDFLNTAVGGRPEKWGAGLFNRLERPAFALRPDLAVLARRLRAWPFLGVRMTGSGSAIFGLCRDAADARRLSREVRTAVDAWVAPAGSAGEDVCRSPRSASSS
jgi:4-diphosphocytidyl-2-C-methyl-D-erythritol kinase